MFDSAVEGCAVEKGGVFGVLIGRCVGLDTVSTLLLVVSECLFIHPFPPSLLPSTRPHPQPNVPSSSPPIPNAMSTKIARTRERSLSPAQQTQKRLKTTHIPSSDAHLVDACQVPVPLTPPDPTPPAAAFADGLLSPQNVQRLHAGYEKSEPWKHCVLDSLVRDDLLESVKEECLSQLSFTQKETDIYKVRPIAISQNR